jgi:hypothetical protein
VHPEGTGLRKLLIVAALARTLAPSTARAGWLFTPNVGGDLLNIDLPLDIDRDFGRATGGVTFRW